MESLGHLFVVLTQVGKSQFSILKGTILQHTALVQSWLQKSFPPARRDSSAWRSHSSASTAIHCLLPAVLMKFLMGPHWKKDH